MAKIFLGRDIDYYLLPDDAAVADKGLELVQEDQYDLIVVYNQEYDDMLDVIRQDYMTTAKAKGASRHRVLYTHALRNAMIPIVTAVGMQFSLVMTGSALAETVFSWPGIGLLIVQSIAKRDTPMVTGSIILCCILMALINLLVDIIYAYCDPRIKAQYSRKG